MKFKAYNVQNIKHKYLDGTTMGLEIDLDMDEELQKEAFFDLWNSIYGSGDEHILKLKDEIDKISGVHENRKKKCNECGGTGNHCSSNVVAICSKCNGVGYV